MRWRSGGHRESAECRFDFATGDVEHHCGHDVMAHQHAEFEELVLVEFAVQSLVGGRGEIFGGEQLVGEFLWCQPGGRIHVAVGVPLAREGSDSTRSPL